MSLPRQMNAGCHPFDRRTCAHFLGADEKETSEQYKIASPARSLLAKRPLE